jgi:hypothetical protein
MKYQGPPQSGSLQSITYSRNQFGQYTRNRTSPTQSMSMPAVTSRSVFATVVAAWNTISDAQRVGWNELAKQLPKRDRLGVQRSRSGRSVFIEVNQAKLLWVAPGIEADPVPLPFWDLVDVSLAWSGVLPDLVIDWNPTPARGLLILYGSPVVSSGALAVTTAGTLLEWQTVNLSAVTPPFTTGNATNWSLRFGTVPTAGQSSFFGARQYNAGWLSPLRTFRVTR